MSQGVTPQVKCEITQGATFRKTFYYFSGADVIKPVTAIARTYPALLTATAHTLPTVLTPVSLIECNELSSTDLTTRSRIMATRVDANTFTIPVDATAITPYTSGGYVQFTPPVDLSMYTGRAQIRATVNSAVLLLALTTENGRMSLDANGGCTLYISDADTALLTFATAVAQIELQAPGTNADVKRLIQINFTLSPESTR